MSGNNWLRFHRDQVRGRCWRLRSWLQELSVQPYPSTAPGLVLGACLGAVARQTARIDRLDMNKTETLQASVVIGSVDDFLNELEMDILPILSGAPIPTTLAAITGPIERVVNPLVGQCSLLFTTLPWLNYSTTPLGQKMQKVFRAVNCADLLATFPANFFGVVLTAFTPNGVLTHSLIGHEIGHILYDKNRIDGQLSQALPDYSLELQSVSGGSLQEEHRFKRLLTAWMEEFACDILGLLLLGPAYFYSAITFMTSFAGTNGLDSAENHPSPRRRINLLADLMKGDYGTAYGYKANGIPLQLVEDIQSYLALLPESGLPRLDKLCYSILDQTFPAIVTELVSATGKSRYTQAMLDHDLEHLLPRLTYGAPINEYEDAHQPAALPSILNTAWHYFLQSPSVPFLGNRGTPEERKGQLYQIIEWSLEAGELQLQWAETPSEKKP